MASHWTSETVRSELETVSQCLEGTVTAYLAGGSAMVVQGFKERTPDVDLIVPSETGLERLQKAVTETGYSQTRRLEDADGTALMCQFQGANGREIDIFNIRIGDGLVLSDGIRRRSEPYIDTELADISVISPEDIYLSKLVHSGRPKDVPDTTSLSLAELDFDTIRNELARQNELADDALPSLLLFDPIDDE